MSSAKNWEFPHRMLACYSLLPWVNEDFPPLVLDACTAYVDPRCKRIAEERGYRLQGCDITAGDKLIDLVDIQRLPYKASQFRGVVSSDTLEHVPDMDVALHELHRVTEPGGFLVLCLPVCFLPDGTKRKNTEKAAPNHPAHHLWNPGMDMEARVIKVGYSLVARLECVRWDKMKTSAIWLMEKPVTS